MANATAQPASAESEPRARPAEADPTTEAPELSPLWGLVLVLGEIAQRVERTGTQHDDE